MRAAYALLTLVALAGIFTAVAIGLGTIGGAHPVPRGAIDSVTGALDAARLSSPISAEPGLTCKGTVTWPHRCRL